MHTQSAPKHVRLPYWLGISGALLITGSAILAGRIVWEETVWTWTRGPQMVGFSLAHGEGAVLLLFPSLLMLWFAVAFVLTLIHLFRKKPVSRAQWIELALAFLVLGTLLLPEGFWERIFIGKMASSAHAADLTVYAAYNRDDGVVRAMLSHGVSVNAIKHSDWRTPLHAASSAGDVSLIEYLLSQGASINSLDRSGDSPLDLAIANHHDKAAAYLTSRGAKRIHGDQAQHREEIEERNR